jgi:5'-AMP-activated protein kinase catalytic alpha subunit
VTSSASFNLSGSSFSQVSHETPSSAPEAWLYGSPTFGLRQDFTAERKWALGLQVIFGQSSSCYK